MGLFLSLREFYIASHNLFVEFGYAALHSVSKNGTGKLIYRARNERNTRCYLKRARDIRKSSPFFVGPCKAIFSMTCTVRVKARSAVWKSTQTPEISREYAALPSKILERKKGISVEATETRRNTKVMLGYKIWPQQCLREPKERRMAWGGDDQESGSERQADCALFSGIYYAYTRPHSRGSSEKRYGNKIKIKTHKEYEIWRQNLAVSYWSWY